MSLRGAPPTISPSTRKAASILATIARRGPHRRQIAGGRAPYQNPSIHLTGTPKRQLFRGVTSKITVEENCVEEEAEEEEAEEEEEEWKRGTEEKKHSGHSTEGNSSAAAATTAAIKGDSSGSDSLEGENSDSIAESPRQRQRSIRYGAKGVSKAKFYESGDRVQIVQNSCKEVIGSTVSYYMNSFPALHLFF